MYRFGVQAVVAGLLAVFVGVLPARAQFEPAHETPSESALEVPAEQTINLFASWQGGTSIDGAFVDVPSGWQVEAATALVGATRRVPLEVRRQADGTYFAGADETLNGRLQLIVRVRTGAEAPSARWAVVPFSYRSEQRLRRLSRFRMAQDLQVRATPEADGNQVLAFDAGASPLLLDRSRLPSLSTRTPFTVEAWLKTTGLGEVVLSTWDGTEQQSYSMEWVVGPGGHLRYYRGRQGRHESMATPAPVADGAWHHVAVTHDPEAGRSRLLLDGTAVDSLRGTIPLDPNTAVVALGGRAPRTDAAGTGGEEATSFSGMVDEVQFWPQARPVATVQRSMHQRPERDVSDAARVGRYGDDDVGGPVLLGFDDGERWPPSLLTQEPRGVRRVRSGLRFYTPLAGLRARTSAEAIMLSWTASARGAFVVERSATGTPGSFEVVGRRESRSGTGRYTFTDPEASGEVVFYRIRQQFDDGAPQSEERVSGTLKVGRGAAEQEARVTLMGNFPNPFGEETTIAYEVHRGDTPVRLEVWELTGQRVATLVDETQSAGYQEVPFRPDNLSSGTYFVRLTAGGKTHTRKIALVK